MARGNQGRVVYRDDRDRLEFSATLGEACGKTGWRINDFGFVWVRWGAPFGPPKPGLRLLFIDRWLFCEMGSFGKITSFSLKLFWTGPRRVVAASLRPGAAAATAPTGSWLDATDVTRFG